MNVRVPIAAQTVPPTLIAASGARALLRLLEFFAANIRNQHTRRPDRRAGTEFLTWCADNQVPSIEALQPLHVAAWIKVQIREHAVPIVKPHLAALRHLFDWLVTGLVTQADPIGSVRGAGASR
jgi:site-specific recombinase XerD